VIEQIVQDNVLRAQDGDVNAANALEEHIEQQGLESKYISALLVEIDPDAGTWDIIDDSDQGGGWLNRAFLFKLIRATPEQKARAFREATKT
jgi:hypothetical protein